MNIKFDSNQLYLTNDQGNPVGIILSIENYKKIMSELENYRDTLVAEEAYEELTAGRTLEETIDTILQKNEN